MFVDDFLHVFVNTGIDKLDWKVNDTLDWKVSDTSISQLLYTRAIPTVLLLDFF